MKILITGNLGYIGSVLTNRIDKNKFEIEGLDIGFYKNCHFSEVKSEFKQIYKDIRDIDEIDIRGYDGNYSFSITIK